MGAGDDGGLGVTPEVLRAAARALHDDAGGLGRAGIAASDALTAAGAAAGEGPLAAALGRLVDQLGRAVRGIADATDRAAQGLEGSATTYRTQDSTTAGVLGDVLLPGAGTGPMTGPR